MITADNDFTLEAGSEKRFKSSSKISSEPQFLPTRNLYSVKMIVINSTDEREEARTILDLTKSEVDAETGSGSGETDNWYTALQEAVITKLEALTENSGVTFTASL